jgi:hypothetical protein
VIGQTMPPSCYIEKAEELRPILEKPKSDIPHSRRQSGWRWLRGSSLQHRRKMGRQYLRAYAWFMLAANCMLLAWFATHYFGGTLHRTVAIRYAVGILAAFAMSGILIFAAKSESE